MSARATHSPYGAVKDPASRLETMPHAKLLLPARGRNIFQKSRAGTVPIILENRACEEAQEAVQLMGAMEILLTVWGVLTTALVVLLIYRGTLAMHEDDQIFLSNAEAHLESEQRDLAKRMDHIQPYVTALAASSGLLVLVMAGLWLWRGWNRL
jgi:hypothetical protein